MAWQSWVNRTNSLPMILSGPILRRVDSTSATVWLAFQAPKTVTLRVFKSNPEEAGALLGTRRTIKVAEKLHIVAVTATGGALVENQVYQYNVYLQDAPDPDTPGTVEPDPETPGTPVPVSNPNLTTADILRKGNIGPQTLGYSGGPALPSFALAPADLNKLRIFHGSCRKPHGGGRDHLRQLNNVVGVAANQPLVRPHLFFMTGDQIYADDVADVMLKMAIDVGQALGFKPVTVPKMTDFDLVPSRREPKLVLDGITGGDFPDAGTMQSHLITLAEFAGMYLLTYSDVFWQPEEIDGKTGPTFPTYEQVFGEEMPPEDTQQTPRECYPSDLRKVANFWQDLAPARQALANVPTFMIFDDHEITDDWFLDRRWVDSAADSERTLFRTVIRNGTAAYALFQGWGNDPAPFATSTSKGFLLLKALSNWARQTSTASETDVTHRLGLPIGEIVGDVAAYPKNIAAMDWFYKVEGSSFRVLVLDTRTCRAYKGRHDHPGLIDVSLLGSQLPPPPSGFTEENPTIVISPAPVVGNPTIETLQGIPRKVGLSYTLDAEAWIGNQPSFQAFLLHAATLGGLSRSRLVFLSGDVHYGYSAQFRFITTKPFGQTSPSDKKSVIAQFTSSPFKNEGFPGTTMHTDGRVNIVVNIGESLPQVTSYCWNNPSLEWRKMGDDSEGNSVYRGSGVNPIVWELTNDVTLTIGAPDWKTKLKFFRSEVPRSLSTPAKPVPTTGGTPAEKVQANLDTAGNHQAYQREISNGANAVGRNNLGELSFAWGSGENKSAIHSVYWVAGQEDNLADPVLGRFTVPMSLDSETF
jgi:hypothetical protein